MEGQMGCYASCTAEEFNDDFAPNDFDYAFMYQPDPEENHYEMVTPIGEAYEKNGEVLIACKDRASPIVVTRILCHLTEV